MENTTFHTMLYIGGDLRFRPSAIRFSDLFNLARLFFRVEPRLLEIVGVPSTIGTPP